MRVRLLVLVTLCSLAVIGLVPAAGVQAQEEQQDPGGARTERTSGDAVGVSISHPASWSVEREPYVYSGTYGYTLWRPEPGAEDDHGGTPAVRVALAYGLEPGQVDAEVEKTLAYYGDEDLAVERAAVSVGETGHEGVAVGPIPGSTPFTRVYVPVGGRVYQINVYSERPGEEGLDADDKGLLSNVRFYTPSRTVRSLGLPAANSPEALYPSGEEARAIAQHDDGKGFGSSPSSSTSIEEDSSTSPTALRSGTVRSGGTEARIDEGCWRADPDYYVQTQHGYGANSSARDGIPTGWTRIGLPNFWGEYTHGNLGYGRCNEPYYTNDKFAVDYPLDRGNYVFSPFNCGRVTYAGRNDTHADYGIFVSIRACNGKYVNLSGHLSALRNGLGRGDKVTRDTVIGYAGDTGGGRIPVGRVHLHTAFYRYPSQNPDGSPYGGAGLLVGRNHYVGTAARKRGIKVSSHVYNYANISTSGAFCRESIRCGKKYLVSN